MPSVPLLSYVLATDSYATIRPVLKCLLRQTLRQRLEVVLATPSPQAVREALGFSDRFAGIRIVEEPQEDLAPARAAGVLAASAPLVFIGETHSFPRPELAETIVAAFRTGDWACVAPAVGNANPRGVWSWSGYLLDYARWVQGLEAGRIAEAPVYNAAYRVDILQELGERLPFALGQSDELHVWIRQRGYPTLFEPRARIDHVNVTRPKDWIRDRFQGGLLIAANRSQHWPLVRRVLYVGGWFLIPVVLLRRVLPGLRQVGRVERLPRGTLTMAVLGLFLRAAGEMLGYAGLFAREAERGMNHLELHKLRYVAGIPDPEAADSASAR